MGFEEVKERLEDFEKFSREFLKDAVVFEGETREVVKMIAEEHKKNYFTKEQVRELDEIGDRLGTIHDMIEKLCKNY